MARTILGEYGPDTPKLEAPRIMKNGPAECKPLPYDPPVGPMGIGNRSVGLGGVNLGNAGSQGKSSLRGDGGAGAPGITRLGGENEDGGSQHG